MEWPSGYYILKLKYQKLYREEIIVYRIMFMNVPVQ